MYKDKISNLPIHTKDYIICQGFKEAGKYIELASPPLTVADKIKFTLAELIVSMSDDIRYIHKLSDLSKVGYFNETNEIISHKYSKAANYYTDANNDICDIILELIQEFLGAKEFENLI